MDSTAAIDKPVRVMIWTVPRSLSTVLLKCISFVPNSQIINEPNACAYHLGPEKYPPPDAMVNKDRAKKYNEDLQEIKFDLPMAFTTDQCTYEFVKHELEADYPGKQLVFCKDMAYALDGKYGMLPRGYRHTFLIRNPYRVFPSYKKLFQNVMSLIWKENDFRLTKLPLAMVPKNYCVQEQYELMSYLKDHGEQNPIIIDADDLLNDPVSTMSKYCTLVGIPFKKEMLEWPSGMDVIKSWKGAREILLGNLHPRGGYYDTALQSSRFHPLKEMPRREDLSEDILECVDYSMPYYRKMYDWRIK